VENGVKSKEISKIMAVKGSGNGAFFVAFWAGFYEQMDVAEKRGFWEKYKSYGGVTAELRHKVVRKKGD
jgi:hypothetical protein